MRACVRYTLHADPLALPLSWVGANDWTGRPKVRVALSLDAPAVLALVTQLLSKP